jgi:hypothetical protein
VLDLALDVRELLGGPAATLGFDLDAGTRPGTHSWELSRTRLDGCFGDDDALLRDWYDCASEARGLTETTSVTTFMGDHITVAHGSTSVAWSVWCNFPFSDPKPWVARAIRAARDGCWVSILAPHTTGSWWDDLEGAALATVRLRRVEFEACPGLLDAAGRPARGDRPSQQCSLVTLAPADVAPPAAAITLRRDIHRLGHAKFTIQPGPGLSG